MLELQQLTMKGRVRHARPVTEFIYSCFASLLTIRRLMPSKITSIVFELCNKKRRTLKKGRDALQSLDLIVHLTLLKIR